MKIDKSRLKKSSSEVPLECQALIDKLRYCGRKDLYNVLKRIDTWTFGKCELYHWIDILDSLDGILEECARRVAPDSWVLTVDLPEKQWERELLLRVLNFTTLLIEHSFSRHLYNSVEHLISLLQSCDMNIVLGVLNLLYMFSKRSNFITRLNSEKKYALLSRLTHLAESWGAYEDGVTLEQSCRNVQFCAPAVLRYDYYPNLSESSGACSSKTRTLGCVKNAIFIENIDSLSQSPAEMMNDILKEHTQLSEDKQDMVFSRLRLYTNFRQLETRLLCVQARLQATSVLAYSNAIVENAHTILYGGLLEELVEVVRSPGPNLVDIRAAALRTLTSIIHLDRSPNPHFPKKPGSRLNMIIEVTTASSFHGFLPTFVRSCISTLLTETDLNSPNCPFPLALATALFSFLYHLASYEAGGDALVSCGIMDSLLRVIQWHAKELDHITFVTRAVRVIDLITNIEMQGFQAHGGLQSFINRLEVEVNICRKEQPFVIQTSSLHDCYQAQYGVEAYTSQFRSVPPNCVTDVMDVESVAQNDINLGASTSRDFDCHRVEHVYCNSRSGKTCLPQRAALLKSMLNFLKKAIQDSSFSDSVRLVMGGSLSSSLRHIISNAEYYGPSLFLLATDVVTVYIFQEPSFLSTLQDNGLTYVILNALLIKDVPATREVLGSLPNIFSALCLNSRGLEAFIYYEPFIRLFKILVSPAYLGAMKRRRCSDPVGDTASNLGNAMDELMRHQPTLKQPAILAVNKLLDDLYDIHHDPKYSSWRGSTRSESHSTRQGGNTEGGSSDEDDDDEEEASTSSHPHRDDNSTVNDKAHVPLIDYIINVMKFIDAILSNNSTDDHCREFISLGGVPRLLRILEISYLPLDHPVISAAQAVSTVCKSILSLTLEGDIFKVGIKNLNSLLGRLHLLQFPLTSPGSSVLLHELATQPNIETVFNNLFSLPLLRGINSVHGYIIMFMLICRTSQTEIRHLAISHWASESGLAVLSLLKNLYKALVWESTVLVALAGEEVPLDNDFARDDIERIRPHEKIELDSAGNNSTDMTSNGMTSAMEALSTNDMDTKQEANTEIAKCHRKPTCAKYIKPLQQAASRLGRALAEFFGMLVKLCVGSPARVRRGQRIALNSPLLTPPARDISSSLALLLIEGLQHVTLPTTCIPKFKLAYLIFSLGFASPILFDEMKCAYYLMLYQFMQFGGQPVYFETFHWALSGGYKFDPKIGLEHPELPEGTIEFIDVWLLLLEKLVSPKGILESQYSHVNLGRLTNEFDPVKFMLGIQKAAFDAVMMLWKKKPARNVDINRMTESMFSILKHILKGEEIFYDMVAEYNTNIAPKYNTGTNSSLASMAAASTSTPNTSRDTLDVNPDNLRQLIDMGFSHERCVEALIHTGNVEQATEYLLNNPSPLIRSAQDLALDYYLSDDDQMYRAIAISLGEKTQPCPFEGLNRSPYRIKHKGMLKVYESLLINKKSMDMFIIDVFDSCLEYIDMIPDSAYHAAELLTITLRRNGAQLRERVVEDLVSQIEDYGTQLLEICFDASPDKQKIVSVMLESDIAKKLTGRLHLFTLLTEVPKRTDEDSTEYGKAGRKVERRREDWALRISCVSALLRKGDLDLLIKLINIGEIMFRELSGTQTPNWLKYSVTALMLLEKLKATVERKEKMFKVTKKTWKWYDVSSGKWNNYTAINNKFINDAYFGGDMTVRVSCPGRRRYLLSFQHMSQINEESGNTRPITLSLKCRDLKTYNDEKRDVLREDELDRRYKEFRKPIRFHNYDRSRVVEIVQACVGLMQAPVHPDTIGAAMQLCLRLTRQYQIAKIFVNLGGIQALLKLTQGSADFPNSLIIATLIIRHCLEEDNVLRHTIEKIIRTQVQQSDAPPYRELSFFMLQTSSCVSRAPHVYTDVARNVLRVDLSLLSKRNEEEDQRLVIKCAPTKQSSLVVEDNSLTSVIVDLLNALIEPHHSKTLEYSTEFEKEEKSSTKTVGSFNSTSQLLSVAQNPVQLNGTTTANGRHSPFEEFDERINLMDFLRKKLPRIIHPPLTDEEKKKLLLPRSAILKILADIAKSYSNCAKIITDHFYTAGQTELIKEDCSALAFVLDNLITNKDNNDKECLTMSRIFIVALASCNHCLDSQTTLVFEVKAALLRCLAMAETDEKHARIQQLSVLISSMIYNCPGPTDLPKIPFNQSLNNIVRIMIRKGLITDLARITHSLDLSGEYLAPTMNAVLRTLEVLSRIVNLPVVSSVNKNGKLVPNVPPSDETQGTRRGSSSSANPTDEMVEVLDDSEPAEADVSSSQEMQPIMQSETQIESEDNDLESVIDQLLDSVEVEVEVEPHPRDVDAGDTRLANVEVRPPFRESVAQPLCFVPSSEEHAVAEVDSDDSGDSEPSDNEANNMDEEEDEGDENEEEGGSGYEEDNIEFFESNEGPFGVPSLDRDNEDILMVQYSDPGSSGSGPWNSNALPLSFGIYEDPQNGNDSTGSGVPPGHPLIVARRNVATGNLTTSRTHRAIRHRRYQYLQVNTRNPNSPVILQRLLGPAALELTIPMSPMAITEFPDTTRVVVMDNGLSVVAGEDDPMDVSAVEPPNFIFGPNVAATVHSIPPALFWWYEESKILDMDSQPDAIIGVCHDIIKSLEKHKAEDLAQRKEMLKKKQEEQHSRKKGLRKRNNSGDMEVTPCNTQQSTVDPPDPESLINSLNNGDSTRSLAESIVESVLNSTASQASTRHSSEYEIGSGLPLSLSEIIPNPNALFEVVNIRGVPTLVDPDRNVSNSIHSMIIQNCNVDNSNEQEQSSPEYEANTEPNSGREAVGNSTSGMPQRCFESSISQDGSRSGELPNNPMTDPPSAEEQEDSDQQESDGDMTAYRPLQTVPSTFEERCPVTGYHRIPTVQSLRERMERGDTYPPPPLPLPTIPPMLAISGSQQIPPPSILPYRGEYSIGHYARMATAQLMALREQGISLMPPLSGSSSTRRDPERVVDLEELYFRDAHPELFNNGGNTDNSQSQTTQREEQRTPPSIPEMMRYRGLSSILGEPSPDYLAEAANAIARESMELARDNLRENSNTASDGRSASDLVVSLPSSVPITHQPSGPLPTGSDSVQTGDPYSMEMGTPLSGVSANSGGSRLRLSFRSRRQPLSRRLSLRDIDSGYRAALLESQRPRQRRSSTQENTENVPPYSRPITETLPTPSGSTIPSATSAEDRGQAEQELPEGVDPSFLAALPDDMRQEVIAEQLRLQRLRQRATQQTRDSAPTNMSEVNPEFLAALPPSIQEEVLAQQRLEQQRQAAVAANPDDPVDAAEFFQNLQPSLRQAILTDMEESQISVLPPDLAQEAQNLRREWEARNRQLMQERFFSHVSHNSSALSSILRNAGRVASARYAIHSVPQRAQWHTWQNTSSDQRNAQAPNLVRSGGRALLDNEALTCLLVLLFTDKPSLNMGRLHRVLRNLCYHAPTREWMMKALLSILEKCSFSHKNGLPESKRMATRSQSQSQIPSGSTAPGSWLNTIFNYALGRQTEVFALVKYPSKRGLTYIGLQPRACPFVFRHTIDVLISMAKSLPGQFLSTLKNKDGEKTKDQDKEVNRESSESKCKASTSSSSTISRIAKLEFTSFWDILLKLESLNTKKGKSVARPCLLRFSEEEGPPPSIFEYTAFGRLFSLLGSSIIKNNSMLTDKLLRLLSLISIGLPEISHPDKKKSHKVDKEEILPVSLFHLKLVIEVLTSQSCSEEGLEDVTALLLNLSNCFDPAKNVILNLLLDGAMELAWLLKQHIKQVWKDLKTSNKQLKRQQNENNPVPDKPAKGTLTDRFTKDNVVINSPLKNKGRYDWSVTNVHLLTSKSSSQMFFLRTLKVIVQIRESVRVANKRQKDAGEDQSSNDDCEPIPTLCELLPLDDLWETLSLCLTELAQTPDSHAVLVLQPAVEAFFLVHSSTIEDQKSSTTNAPEPQAQSESQDSSSSVEMGISQGNLAPVSPLQSDSEGTGISQSTSSALNLNWDNSAPVGAPLPIEQQKFLQFAETHRTVLNEILRQSTTNLADGPFSVLVDHTRVLDFDVKRRYFRSELDRLDEGIRREELAVHVRRSHVFEDSFRELHRRTADEWKNRFYIVFEGEEGQDAGGLLREWYVIISREIFNPMYALFTTSPGDRVTYMINPASHCNPNHLCYFKFVGRVIAKAIYDNKLLECYFTRSFYKHILGISVKYTDMESEDYSFYQGLVYLMEHHVSDLGYDLTFSAEVQEFGVTDVRDLITNGRNIPVCEQNKMDYIRLVCQMKMTGAIRKQIYAFLEGFYDIIPKRLISIFNEQELELLISGMPNVDIEDLKANTEYHKYTTSSLQIQWFWRALRDFDQANRAKFLQFVTGTSKVPLQGFAALEGMNGVQKFQIHRDDRSTDRLPSAHTCFNQLDLPVYETYDKLRTYLLKAIHECSEGFGFA